MNPGTEATQVQAETGLEAASLLERLVTIPSPTGEEAAAVAFLQEQARSDGLRVTKDTAGNFIAEAGTGHRLLVFVGHVDTVPGSIPVRVEDGELWGRGSVDAKGSLVAAYCAARKHLDDPSVRIRIVGAVDEEGHSRGARALPADWNPHWVVVGEPSGAHGVTLGYKGILRGTATVQRPRMHGGHPGTSAPEAAWTWWQTVRDRLTFNDGFDDVSGRLDAMDTRSDGLADTATAAFQLRLPPTLGPGDAEAILRSLADAHDCKIHIEEALAAVLAPRRTPLVAAFLATLRDQGASPRLIRKTGTCDMNILAHTWPDAPIVAYGPGDSSLDHTPDERIRLAELEEAVRVWDGVIGRLAGTG